jgi:hypothetical protein
MLNVPHEGPSYLDVVNALVPPPQSGAQFRTIVGEAKTLAVVFLAPGTGLNRAHRRMAEAHPLVQCSVRGDPDGIGLAALPEHFHEITLRWMIHSADNIAIWSAPCPQRSDDMWKWDTDAVNAGAHFLTTIETNEDRAPEWAALIERWKRKSCRVVLFSSVKATGAASNDNARTEHRPRGRVSLCP